MPEHGHVCGVEGTIGRDVVENPAETPRPATDRAPFVGLGTVLAGPVEQGLYTVLEPTHDVRIEVAVVGRDQRVAAGQDRLERPARSIGAA